MFFETAWPMNMMGGWNNHTEKQGMSEVKVSGGDGGVGGEADWKTQRCRHLLRRGYYKTIPLAVIAQLMEREVLNRTLWQCWLLTAPWKITATSKQCSIVDLQLI